MLLLSIILFPMLVSLMIDNVVWNLIKFFDRSSVPFRKLVSPIMFLSGTFVSLKNIWAPLIIWVFVHYSCEKSVVFCLRYHLMVFCFHWISSLFRWMPFLKELLPQRMSWHIIIREMVIFLFLVSLRWYFLVLLFFLKFIIVIHKCQYEIYWLYN